MKRWTLLVAFFCVLSLGVAGTTFDSTLTTDPDEAIDPDYELLPIGPQDARWLMEELDGESSADPSGDSTHLGGEPSGPLPDAVDRGEGGGSDIMEALRGASDFEIPPPETGAFEWLVALMTALLRLLLPVIVILGMGVIVYQYHDRIPDRFRQRSPPDRESEQSGNERWPSRPPGNAVEEAYIRLLQMLFLDPTNRTSRECASRAQRDGYDESDVETIVLLFEAIRFGGEPVTETAERQARQAIDRLERGTVDD